MQVMVKEAYAFGDDWGDEDEDAGPSKSEVKRRLLAIQKLGRDLTALPPETLRGLPIPQEALEALLEYPKIKTFKARQRHIRYIGKLLRDVDREAVEKAVEEAQGKGAAMTALLHRCEDMRERLIASDDELPGLIEKCPGLDVQRLRQAVRKARREAAKPEGEARDPRPARLVFQILREAFCSKEETKSND